MLDPWDSVFTLEEGGAWTLGMKNGTIEVLPET